ncbi:MAG: hypothetical protein ACP5D7_21910 [Limnospira sp.]
MNVTTTAILFLSLSTLNSTQPESELVSTKTLPLSIALVTPELAAIQTANNVDESDDDCDIVPPA